MSDNILPTFAGPDHLVYHFAPPENGYAITGFTFGRTIQVSQYNPIRLEVVVTLGPNADVWTAIGETASLVTENLLALREEYAAANATF